MICGWWCLENFEENKEVGIYMNQRVKTMHRYIPLVKELVIRDLKVKYRRSFLGYLWSLLNPLLMMLVMTIAFSYVFRFDIENYSLYLITGQIIYNFFNESTSVIGCPHSLILFYNKTCTFSTVFYSSISSFGECARFRHPFSVITTRSSILTPPNSGI